MLARLRIAERLRRIRRVRATAVRPDRRLGRQPDRGRSTPGRSARRQRRRVAMTQKLDAARLALHGSRLIEASAGTGKTWTIAALYLRLVLGHGEPGAAFDRPLLPAEILVMTFTRAATRELSDRIRARLVEAARCFRGETVAGQTGGSPPDELIAALMADYPDDASRQQAAWRLAMAAEAMDD